MHYLLLSLLLLFQNNVFSKKTTSFKQMCFDKFNFTQLNAFSKKHINNSPLSEVLQTPKAPYQDHLPIGCPKWRVRSILSTIPAAWQIERFSDIPRETSNGHLKRESNVAATTDSYPSITWDNIIISFHRYKMGTVNNNNLQKLQTEFHCCWVFFHYIFWWVSMPP